MVKIEGGAEMAPTVEFLVRRGIPVCAHIGLTPQHVNVFGGYRVQGAARRGRAPARAARRLQDAGAAMMVIEAVPEPLARRVAEAVQLITIGIGASVACSGQVLVLHDLLGAGVGKRPRFVKNFLQGAASLEAAVGAYVAMCRPAAFRPRSTSTPKRRARLNAPRPVHGRASGAAASASVASAGSRRSG
jgi:3-methyl-2-oxobutanoate hydroxymethyltransferase